MNMKKQSLLTPAYYGTGRVIVAYSGFGLLKTATALIKCDLYCSCQSNQLTGAS